MKKPFTAILHIFYELLLYPSFQGYPFTEDMNGYQQEGVGLMDATVHNGMRWSAASAYLRPALQRQVRFRKKKVVNPTPGLICERVKYC